MSLLSLLSEKGRMTLLSRSHWAGGCHSHVLGSRKDGAGVKTSRTRQPDLPGNGS